MPEPHALAVLLLTAFALVLFTRDRIPLETSSLLVLVALLLGFELFPLERAEARIDARTLLSGFGHEALVAVCALMIAGQGLVRTGALEPVGRLLARIWTKAPTASLALTLLVGALCSAFVNNVPVVVLLLPILVSVSLRTGHPASAVLMPMGFATLIGGMATTIGTSTNLLVTGMAVELGLAPFGLFDFLLPAAAAGGVGLLYLWLVAPRLLPPREQALGDASPRLFTASLELPEDSEAVGRTLRELVERAGGDLPVDRILRGEHTPLMPLPDLVLRPGDRLRLTATPERLKALEERFGGRLHSGETASGRPDAQRDGDQRLAEVVVTQGSPLEGATLAQSPFMARHGLRTLALHRPGRRLRRLARRIDDIPLRVGDIVLIQGDGEAIERLRRQGRVLVLDATTTLPRSARAGTALAIMAGIVLPAALGWLPIVHTALAGVLAMLLTRCLDWRDAARALSTQVILIVAASLALARALLETGAADWLAGRFVALAAGAPPEALLSGLMLLMALFTNVVSNNAAALIGTPVAVGMAQRLGLPPEPFVLAVLFGANMSYATPIAYKTNLLVMSAGGYRFGDFVRVGLPLTLLLWGTLSFLLPTLYPLR